MSRSYKKVPMIKERTRSKNYAKRRANKATRKCNDITDGKSFKKAYESWKINGYKFLSDNEEALRK